MVSGCFLLVSLHNYPRGTPLQADMEPQKVGLIFRYSCKRAGLASFMFYLHEKHLGLSKPPLTGWSFLLREASQPWTAAIAQEGLPLVHAKVAGRGTRHACSGASSRDRPAV